MKSERREDACWREREEEESGGGDGTNKELKCRLNCCISMEGWALVGVYGVLGDSMNFSTFFYTPKKQQQVVFFYLARHVVATHLEHLQLVPNLLKIFGTPSSVFVQLGSAWNLVVYS